MYPILDFYEMLKKKASILVTKSSFGFTLDLKNMFTFDKPLELLRVIVNIHWVDFFVVRYPRLLGGQRSSMLYIMPLLARSCIF
jgi:hypothetical protein